MLECTWQVTLAARVGRGGCRLIATPHRPVVAGTLLVACICLYLSASSHQVSKSRHQQVRKRHDGQRAPGCRGLWLVLASHSRVLQHCVQSGASHVLHEGQVGFVLGFVLEVAPILRLCASLKQL